MNNYSECIEMANKSRRMMEQAKAAKKAEEEAREEAREELVDFAQCMGFLVMAGLICYVMYILMWAMM